MSLTIPQIKMQTLHHSQILYLDIIWKNQIERVYEYYIYFIYLRHKVQTATNM